MKQILLLCILLCPSIALAITNGTADIAWDNNLPPGATVTLQYQSFANGTWQAFASQSAPVLNAADGKMHSAVTFPAFPADNATDHWLCVRADDTVNGQTSPWTSDTGQTVCTQVPVPAIVVTPPPPPPPPPAPTGLQIGSATPNQVIITASAKDCPHGISTSSKGSTTAVQKRTITCVK